MLGLAPSTRLHRGASCTAGTDTSVSRSTETEPNRLSQRHELVRFLPNTDTTVLRGPNDSALRMNNGTHIYGLQAEPFDPPPPYEIRATPLTSAQREVQLPRRPDPRVQPRTWLAQPPIKVAMLPLLEATEGFRYMETAMHDCSVQDSPTPGRGILYCLYTLCYTVWRTYLASRESRYTDESRETQVFSHFDQIGPGEVERPIWYQCYDWTLDWNVHLIVQTVGDDDDGSWAICAYIFFSSLSGLGVGLSPGMTLPRRRGWRRTGSQSGRVITRGIIGPSSHGSFANGQMLRDGEGVSSRPIRIPGSCWIHKPHLPSSSPIGSPCELTSITPVGLARLSLDDH